MPLFFGSLADESQLPELPSRGGCYLERLCGKAGTPIQGPADPVSDVVLILTEKLKHRFDQLVVKIQFWHLLFTHH
jgi:hypothetical protein